MKFQGTCISKKGNREKPQELTLPNLKKTLNDFYGLLRLPHGFLARDRKLGRRCSLKEGHLGANAELHSHSLLSENPKLVKSSTRMEKVIGRNSIRQQRFNRYDTVPACLKAQEITKLSNSVSLPQQHPRKSVSSSSSQVLMNQITPPFGNMSFLLTRFPPKVWLWLEFVTFLESSQNMGETDLLT